MRDHKVPLTRPGFMHRIIIESGLGYTEENISDIIPEATINMHAMYTVLLESSIRYDDIVHVSSDGETVVVELRNKAMAKAVVDNYTKTELRYGSSLYDLHISINKASIFVDVRKIED